MPRRNYKGHSVIDLFTKKTISKKLNFSQIVNCDFRTKNFTDSRKHIFSVDGENLIEITSHVINWFGTFSTSFTYALLATDKQMDVTIICVGWGLIIS